MEKVLIYYFENSLLCYPPIKTIGYSIENQTVYCTITCLNDYEVDDMVNMITVLEFINDKF